jgi:hypothetical protein
MNHITTNMRKVYSKIYPLFFALYPVLFLFAKNKEEVFPTDILKPSIAILAAALLIYAALLLLLKNTGKAAFLTSFFTILFFSYGAVKSFFPSDFNINVLQYKIGADKILTALWLIASLAGIIITIKLGKKLERVNEMLAIVSLILISLSLSSIVPYEIRTKRLLALFDNQQSQKANNATAKKMKTQPDIYYLIFDRYGSSQTLKEKLKFDNLKFESYLKGKGFYIANKSYANYAKTFESLASSLNMKHLTYLENKYSNSSDQTIIFNMIEYNEVAKTLQASGYTYYHFGTSWGPTRESKIADVNINWTYFGIDEFSTMLLETTPLYPIAAKKKAIDFGDENYLRVEQKLRIPFQISELKKLPKKPSPKYIFAHFLLPHGPYVFDAKGNTISEKQAKKRSEGQSYLDHVKFANLKIREIVDNILKNSKTPPVIIIQSDEGPCGIVEELSIGRGWGHCGEGQHWTTLSNKALQAKMRIFNAYYLPGVKMENVLYPDITPVNTFRIIFNQYFGADYKLLPDKSYVFEDLKHPYKFVEVTSRVAYD